MRMCQYTCTYTRTQIVQHMHIRTLVHIYTHIQTHIQMHVFIMHVHVRVQLYIQTHHVCMCIRIWTCQTVHVYMSISAHQVQGGKNSMNAFNHKSLSAKEPLIMGFLCGKRPTKIRYLMHFPHYRSKTKWKFQTLHDMREIHTSTNEHMRVHILFSIYIYVYIHIYVHIHVYIYKHMCT